MWPQHFTHGPTAIDSAWMLPRAIVSPLDYQVSLVDLTSWAQNLEALNQGKNG